MEENMKEYTVSFNDRKNIVKVKNNQEIIFNDKLINVELQKINAYCYLLKLDNKVHEVLARKVDQNTYEINIRGKYIIAEIRTKLQEKAKEILNNKILKSHKDIIKSPLPGMILRIYKKCGDLIEFGEPVLELEAMKMENEIKSTATGKIREINGKAGEKVDKDTLLLIIE
jgi:biotin carboxyl carrier protein